jgi:hypothetical protein
MKKVWYFLIFPVFLIVLLFFTRLILPIQIDDVSSSIPCENWLLEKANVYYVIPRFNGTPNNKSWCEEILNRNKELAIHGVTHEYKEFSVYRNNEYLDIGLNDFKECFGFYPEKFKAPNLAWNNKNNWIKNKMEIQVLWNQITHKVYHCNDTGLIPNNIIKIF